MHYLPFGARLNKDILMVNQLKGGFCAENTSLNQNALCFLRQKPRIAESSDSESHPLPRIGRKVDRHAERDRIRRADVGTVYAVHHIADPFRIRIAHMCGKLSHSGRERDIVRRLDIRRKSTLIKCGNIVRTLNHFLIYIKHLGIARERETPALASASK